MNQLDEALAKTFLTRFSTKKHMKDWIWNFLGFDMPDSFVDPDSNSSPIGWMFEVYKMYENNQGAKSPSVIVISSRESYKTLTESMLALILMVQFGTRIAHMAAIVPQAQAAQSYLEMFLASVKPYMDYHKLQTLSQNSKEIEIQVPNRNDPSKSQKALMQIVVCTVTGANSKHTGIFTIDEIDTIRSKEGIRAYKEACLVPGVFPDENGVRRHPITIKTSTLKFPGGLFTKELTKALKKGWKVFRWNLIDITEACPPERHLPHLPKEVRYVGRGLPIRNLTEAQYLELMDKEKEDFVKIDAMAGCAKCPLLPVCKGRLAARSPEDTGGLWKPIDFTISQFDNTDVDIAESQLMCWKPSSQGLVYPRFLDKDDGTGNTYTVAQAWKVFTGNEAPKHVGIKDLTELMLSKGVRFYGGVDWGSTHAFAITISALLPNKEWWFMDTYSVPGLEFEQMMSLSYQVRDMYARPKKWFPDNSQPMFIKAFNKNKMPCQKFTKDVRGGIECTRGQIVDAMDHRRLKVIKHQRNDMLLRVFAEHTFKLDSNGNLTDDPDDSDVADVADTVRYQAQNLFAPKGKFAVPTGVVPVNQYDPAGQTMPSPQYEDWLSLKIRELASAGGGESKGKDASGTVLWDFGDSE